MKKNRPLSHKKDKEKKKEKKRKEHVTLAARSASASSASASAPCCPSADMTWKREGEKVKGEV
eukprot:1664080-Rhodomonas_salina.1